MTDKTITETLADIVTQHLPTATRTRDGETIAQGYARTIIHADVAAEKWLGFSNDLPALEDLSRALRDVRRAFNSLSLHTQLSFQRLGYEDLIELMVRAELAEESVSARIRSERSVPVAGAKRNWRAAAVADACRTVWAAEDWHSRVTGTSLEWASGGVNALAAFSDPDRMEVCRVYYEWIRSMAPEHDKADAPGPFGRFLEDVAEGLGIKGRNGTRLTAASALRAVAQAREQYQRNS